jgi:hypothetical protein
MTGMAILVVTFVVGALTGAATLQVLSADDGPAVNRNTTRPEPPDFLDRLNLTADQRVMVEQILERRRAQMESFWDQHRPTLRGIADSARVELRAVLTPEQLQLEERYHAERQRDHGDRSKREKGDGK